MPALKKAQALGRGRQAVAKPVTKKPGIQVSFKEFFLVWASQQTGWEEVPSIHYKIMDFLTDFKNWKSNTGVLQVFRGASKSTIVGLFVVWMLTQDPTLRFLILSEKKDTATKITLAVSHIIQRHPLAKHLHGDENINRADALYVRGFTDPRTPSITSWGVRSSLTGARADWIIYDDTEGSSNSNTETERDNLRDRLAEPAHFLVPGGYELFVGTPHSYDSIYPEILGEVEKESPVRRGATGLKIPIADGLKGEFPNFTDAEVLAWPERFSVEVINSKAGKSGTKGEFLSQYLLLPYNPDDTVLDPTLVATYRHNVDITYSNGGVLAKIGQDRVMSVSCFWDPALSTVTTDDSVLAIVYTTDTGHYFIHRTIQLQGDAEEQCEQVVRYMKEFDLPHVVIETNGIGNFLPAILRKRMEGKGLTCEGKATTLNKVKKIMEAYDVRLSGGFLHAHESVMQGRFRTQLRDFSARSAGKSKDDFIDAVAMCILAEPIRLRAGWSGDRTSSWSSGEVCFEMEKDFSPF